MPITFHSRYLLGSAAAGLLLVAAACGNPSLAPATKIAELGPTASPRASASTELAAGETKITFTSSDSKAQYQTQEQLAGHSLPNTAVGSTSSVSGAIILDSTGALVANGSKISVNLTSLKSDESMRDKFVQRNTLQTSQYPEAVFTPTQVTGLPSPLPASGSATFQLTGDLTVHGVTKPATWSVTALFNGDQVSGRATTPFTITSFGMSLPKAGPVLSVQDNGTLELDFSSAPMVTAA